MGNLKIKTQSVCRSALAALIALFAILNCSVVSDGFFVGSPVNRLHSLLYVQEQGSFVTAGSDGSKGLIFKSTDGENWKQINTSSVERSLSDLPSLLLRYYPISSLTFGGGHYIITGQNGMLLVSNDAQNWSPVPLRSNETPITNDLHQIIYAQDRFVVVGDGNSIGLTDDITKGFARVSSAVSGGRLNFISHLNNRYVAVSSGGALTTSLDTTAGSIWNLQSTAPVSGQVSMLYEESVYVIAGSPNQARGGDAVLAYSSDLQSWTKVNLKAPGEIGMADSLDDSKLSLSSLAYDGSIFVAVGRLQDGSFSKGVVLRSDDGTSWTSIDFSAAVGVDRPLNSLIHDGSRFVAVGNDELIITSTNGTDWAQAHFGGKNRHLYAVLYANHGGEDVFAATGTENKILYTRDAATANWEEGQISQ